jgi:bud emergence protein 1
MSLTILFIRARISHVSSQSLPGASGLRSPPPKSPRQRVFYAVVQHDFEAERTDELDAKTGDHISVVAQSNLEWFVAKHINRLGRPGLIPVAFVAVHDPSTGTTMSEEHVRLLMERGDIPKVEEWKRFVIGYKETSISLGTLDEARNSATATTPFVPMPSYQDGPQSSPGVEPVLEGKEPEASPSSLPNGIILSAEVLSWHYEMDEYWFRIHALFQPDGQREELPPAKQLILFRVYNDFYDFQVNLLDTFPTEAGRQIANGDAEPRRILPFMPGPSHNVDDKVTQLRKDELDQYLAQFCGLWQSGAEHILRHRLVLDFFSPKAGDVEEDADPAYRILEERAEANQNGEAERSDEPAGRISDSFSRMNIQDQGNSRISEGSRYDEYGYASSSKSMNGFNGEQHSAIPSPSAQPAAPYRPRSRSSVTNMSRAHSPMHRHAASVASALSPSPRSDYDPTAYAPEPRFLRDDDSPHSYNFGQAPPPVSATPSNGSGATSVKTRSRSGSNAISSPPISANNPNTAYIKVKVFDHVTQELIALRVRPRVTHEQLMERVRERLGSDVNRLAYRNSISNMFVGIDDDDSLTKWLETTDKHTLYAD